MTLKSVQVSPNDYRLALTELVAPGAVVRVDISSENCPTGEEYTYSKSEISLTYDSENIQGKRKFGVADLSGMCN